MDTALHVLRGCAEFTANIETVYELLRLHSHNIEAIYELEISL